MDTNLISLWHNLNRPICMVTDALGIGVTVFKLSWPRHTNLVWKCLLPRWQARRSPAEGSSASRKSVCELKRSSLQPSSLSQLEARTQWHSWQHHCFYADCRQVSMRWKKLPITDTARTKLDLAMTDAAQASAIAVFFENFLSNNFAVIPDTHRGVLDLFECEKHWLFECEKHGRRIIVSGLQHRCSIVFFRAQRTAT